MRKRKTIKIDDREITVKELKVSEIIEILEGAQAHSDVAGAISATLTKCSDVTLDDLKSMAPSEISEIYAAFREVNDCFFGLAREMGLGAVIEELKASIHREFLGTLAASFRSAT